MLQMKGKEDVNLGPPSFSFSASLVSQSHDSYIKNAQLAIPREGIL